MKRKQPDLNYARRGGRYGGGMGAGGSVGQTIPLPKQIYQLRLSDKEAVALIRLMDSVPHASSVIARIRLRIEKIMNQIGGE